MSTYFPTAADLADDTLATKPHSSLHGDLGDALSDRITALGLVDLTGFNSLPTFYDPASTVYTDGGWWAATYTEDAFAFQIGAGPDHATQDIAATSFGANSAVNVQGYAEDDAGNVYGQATLQAAAAKNASSFFSRLLLDSAQTGSVLFRTEDTKTYGQLIATEGQTDPLLDLQDADANSILSVAPDGSVGSVTPTLGNIIAWDNTKWVAQANGDGLSSDYITALGKVDLTGFESLPTTFDPSMSAWGDGWWSLIESVDSGTVTGAHWYNGVFDDGLVTSSLIIERFDDLSQNTLSWSLDNEADTGNVYAHFEVVTVSTASGHSLIVTANSSDTGLSQLTLNENTVTQVLKAEVGQTDPLLDLQDSGSASQFTVTPTTAAFFAAAGLAGGSRPAIPTQVVAVDVDDFNALRTCLIAVGLVTDGD